MSYTYNLFIIIPFSDEFNTVYTEGIRPAVDRVNALGEIFVDANRADFKLRGLEFTTHLNKYLYDADICVSDITSTNPNVMYELGFARALKKKTIIIQRKGEKIPVDISDKFVCDYDPEKLFLLALWLESAIYQAVEDVEIRRRAASDEYQVVCYQNRGVSDLGDVVRKAENVVDILQTNVSTVLNNYLDDLKHALDSHSSLRVRVLTLDPDSSFVNNRADQLGLSTGQYRRELHESIQKLQDSLNGYGERFALQIYDDFPTQIAFLVDDGIYACSIARSNRSRRLCTFKLSVYDAGAERTFRFHFDQVWSIGKPYAPF